MSPNVSLVHSSDEEDDTSEPVMSIEKRGADKVETKKDIKDTEVERSYLQAVSRAIVSPFLKTDYSERPLSQQSL